MPEKKNLPPRDKVETGNPTFDGTFNDHVMKGNSHGTQINGLHCLSQMIAQGKNPVKANVETDRRCPSVSGADVTIGGATKTGTFFPDTWSIDQVRTAVTSAWRDWKTFGTGPSSSICKGLKDKYGLSWAGNDPRAQRDGSEDLDRCARCGRGRQADHHGLPGCEQHVLPSPSGAPALPRCRGRTAGREAVGGSDRVRLASRQRWRRG